MTLYGVMVNTLKKQVIKMKKVEKRVDFNTLGCLYSTLNIKVTCPIQPGRGVGYDPKGGCNG